MRLTTITFLRIIVLGCMIPIIMSIVVYQGFSTNYSTQVFCEQGFRNQYENGIYKYRVVGRYVLIKTYQYIKKNSLPTICPRSLKLLDQSVDPQFYSAYFYVNTFFLCLTCVTLFFILGGTNKNMSFTILEIPILFLCFLMAITQYTIVPYDTLSYFLLSAAILLIIQENQSLPAILILGSLVVLATLTRETAILIMAFYFALNYKSILEKPAHARLNKPQKTLVFISLCFLLTYVGLRVALGYEHAIYQNIEVFNGFDIFLNAGILLVLSITLLVFITKQITKEMIAFSVAALVYILPILIVANPSEIRLWTPLILLFTIMKVRASPLPISTPEGQTIAN